MNHVLPSCRNLHNLSDYPIWLLHRVLSSRPWIYYYSRPCNKYIMWLSRFVGIALLITEYRIFGACMWLLLTLGNLSSVVNQRPRLWARLRKPGILAVLLLCQCSQTSSRINIFHSETTDSPYEANARELWVNRQSNYLISALVSHICQMTYPKGIVLSPVYLILFPHWFGECPWFCLAV